MNTLAGIMVGSTLNLFVYHEVSKALNKGSAKYVTIEQVRDSIKQTNGIKYIILKSTIPGIELAYKNHQKE
ncbi:hypothetical protein JXB27_04030 [Candidatus Woesearchaeota archaeon]|nr:hypothetical protein [Candidatus Woesearchaeota archaeon]